MKYKVGDKVRIVSKRTEGMSDTGRMDEYLGTNMTIVSLYDDEDEELNGDYAYTMEEDGGTFLWDDSMIEYKVDETETASTIKHENPLRYDYQALLAFNSLINDMKFFLKDFHDILPTADTLAMFEATINDFEEIRCDRFGKYGKYIDWDAVKDSIYRSIPKKR